MSHPCYSAAQRRTASSADRVVRKWWSRQASSLRSTAIYSRLIYADQFARPEAGTSRGSRISILRYGSVVLLTGSLAIAQFYFLPNNLGATEFGLAVLGLSVIQAALQFSDAGSINASLRSDLSDDLRVALRVNAVSISSIVCLGGIIVSCGFGLIGASFGYISAAAFACALLLIGGKAHASAAVQMGDEKRSYSTQRHLAKLAEARVDIRQLRHDRARIDIGRSRNLSLVQPTTDTTQTALVVCAHQPECVDARAGGVLQRFPHDLDGHVFLVDCVGG